MFSLCFLSIQVKYLDVLTLLVTLLTVIAMVAGFSKRPSSEYSYAFLLEVLLEDQALQEDEGFGAQLELITVQCIDHVGVGPENLDEELYDDYHNGPYVPLLV
jgi:hypothetical protein